jgi:hypothetical protein
MQDATFLQELGAGGFGMMLGWLLYAINRYRKDVGLGDLATVIGAVGGAAILDLFPAGTDLFGAYGIGLAVGFFGYFLTLVVLVTRSGGAFTAMWFLDGRRRKPAGDEVIPEGTAVTVHPMADQPKKKVGG